MADSKPPASTRRQEEVASALWFVVLLGLVSLCADLTYESARSMVGPFLASLGASGAVVGFVVGAGELLGYVLRLLSGAFADRTRRYWALTLVGYTLNLFAVPLLALAGHWAVAALLVVLERTGKAIRTPARDAMLSFATHSTGRGWGFGLHEALDQIGATFGPLFVGALLAQGTAYSTVFSLLALPAVLALLLLVVARSFFPHPRDLEPLAEPLYAEKFPSRFYLYLAASSLIAAGYADYALIAFHAAQSGHLSPAWVAIAYSLAMAVDGLSALLFGRWFDRIGVRAVVVATLIGAGFPVLAFSATPSAILSGILLWGVAMGAQESIVRAAVASMVPPSLRGTAYGWFHLAYGLSWFTGSVVLGLLYDRSLPAVIGFATTMQLLAVPLFLLAARTHE